MAEADVRTDFFDLLSRRTGWLVALIGSIATINTTMTSCSTQTTNRHSAFRTAVAAEEAYWRERFAEQLAVTEARAKASETQAVLELRLASQCGLVKLRPVPNFREFRLSWVGNSDRAVQLAAEQHALDLKQNFLTNCSAHPAEAVRSAVAEAVFTQTEDAESRATQREARTDNLLPAELQRQDEAAAAAPAAAATPAISTTVSAGTRKGYDVDIFWCVGGDLLAEQARSQLATRLATEVGAPNSGALGGSEVGRVRVRPLPLNRQGGGYPRLNVSPDLIVRHDGNEVKQGQALAAFLSGKGSAAASAAKFDALPGRSDTPWYLSAFVCRDVESAA